MYVGFMSGIKMKSAKPEIGKAPRFSSAHSRYVFYSGLFLESRTPALLSPRPPLMVQYVLFRFLAQRYYFYLTCANFLTKKCENML